MATKAQKKTIAPLKITESSGNVFAGLGLPNPEQELMKARLTLAIYRIVRERELTQAQAAAHIPANAKPRRQFLRWAPHGIPNRPRPGRPNNRPPCPDRTRKDVGSG